MPSIKKGNQYMQVVTYTGNGSTQTVEVGFKIGLLWIKSRSAATDNKVVDRVRGATKALVTNSTAAETTDTNGVTAFTATGFTLGSDSAYNTNGATYVAWCWAAGDTTVANNVGTITSQVCANPTSAFSIVSYTGTGANATVGHGLGVAPKVVIVKRTNSTGDWCVWNQTVVTLGAADRVVFLNSTDVSFSAPTNFNSSAPTSSVINIGTNAATNAAGGTYVAYCWSEIGGFSKFGSYTGNGSADGPFVYTGFRPEFILRKGIVNTGINWSIIDSARNTQNLANANLFPNLSNAESVPSGEVDITSNGFKVRSTSFNISNDVYIYMAFAENPFNYSLAR